MISRRFSSFLKFGADRNLPEITIMHQITYKFWRCSRSHGELSVIHLLSVYSVISVVLTTEITEYAELWSFNYLSIQNIFKILLTLLNSNYIINVYF
jgi:hypothetical protein